MTREPMPTPRDQRIDVLARDVTRLRWLLDRTFADFDDRLRALETFAAAGREPADATATATRSDPATGAPAQVKSPAGGGRSTTLNERSL